VKRSFVLSIILVFIVTSAWAVGTVHNFTTGVMHDAADIYTSSPTVGSVQTEIDSLETAITGTSISLTTHISHTGTSAHGAVSTNTASQIVTRDASGNFAAGTITANLTGDVSGSSGSCTGNAATSSSCSGNAATVTNGVYTTGDQSIAGKKTFSETLTVTAAMTSTIGNVPFLLDPSNCSYFTRFQGNMTDIVNGTYPTYNSSLLKYYQDQFVSDSTTKGTVTNTGFTLTQYEGDAGKFGYGAAFEEARTNKFVNTDDFSGFIASGCTIAFDRYLPDGRKLYKLTSGGSGANYIYQTLTNTAASYTWSISGYSNNVNGNFKTLKAGLCGSDLFGASNTNNVTRYSITATCAAASEQTGFSWNAAGAGEVVYVTSPQFELGSFSTSYSASTSAGASITRSATFAELPVSCVNPSVGSVSFWIKTRFVNNSTDNDIEFFNIGKASTATNFFEIFYNKTTNYLVFDGIGASGAPGALTSISLPYATWTHIAMSWSANVYTCYVNGVSVGTWSPAVAISSFDATAKCLIGKYFYDGASQANFIMSDLAILKIALTAEQVKQIYSGGFRVNAPVVSGEVPNYIAGSLGYTNSWEDYSSSYTGFFQKYGNRVRLSGQIKSGASNSIACTLPVGYRPITSRANSAVSVTDSFTGSQYILTTSAGEVKPQFTGSLTLIVLDDVSFEAAQ